VKDAAEILLDAGAGSGCTEGIERGLAACVDGCLAAPGEIRDVGWRETLAGLPFRLDGGDDGNVDPGGDRKASQWVWIVGRHEGEVPGER
jgi:hypothetical protein